MQLRESYIFWLRTEVQQLIKLTRLDISHMGTSILVKKLCENY
jgi:hypothetical protein